MPKKSLAQKLREAGAEVRHPEWAVDPSLLLLPNIPKPMHGLAPRVILGASWWNKTRKEAYRSTDFHCEACGVEKEKAKSRQWLEGHEVYETKYKEGRLIYLRTAPLCHYCHNFIHSGRLKRLLDKGQVHHAKYAAIIQHGERVLREAGLVKPPIYEGPTAKWSDWRLVLEGQEYASLFSSFEEWARHHA